MNIQAIKINLKNGPKRLIQAVKSHPKTTGLAVFILIFIIAPAFFITQAALNTYQAILRLKALKPQLQQSISQQDLPAIEDNLLKTKKALYNTRVAFAFFKPFQQAPLIGPYITDGNNLIEGALKITDSGLILVQSLSPHADLLGLKGRGTFKGGTIQERLVIFSETLGKQNQDIQKMAQAFDQGTRLINSVQPSKYPKSIRGITIQDKLIKLQEKLDQTDQLISHLPQTIEILPFLLGNNQETKYLVLLQNDAELRPTGGFITAYARLNVKRALISQASSQDIYALDRRFRSRIPAPQPIKEYLVNIPYWYLRDMNLSPDFKVSMETFYTHYQKINPPADVIVAIDTQFVTKFLEILGDLNIPGYGTFSAKMDPDCNCPQVVYKLETIVDKPRSNIVQNRKSVLGPLMKALIDKVLTAPKDKWPILAQEILNLGQQKRLLFYSPRTDIQQVAEAWNFAGRILPNQANQDYLLIADSNMGGAKSNLYITQQVKHKYQLDSDNSLTKTLSITYRNLQPPSDCNLERGNLCLNGEYRDWLRVYVPKGSQLIKATNSLTQVKTYDELGKTVFEAYIKLRPPGFHPITFVYKLPFKLDSFNNFQILIQKQAGVKSADHQLIFPNKKIDLTLIKDSWIKYAAY
ncbi:MAG: DUF4012 domain-containing protein [bacterium]|nr:DUF4012 domain-containing protein [bacterium]